MAGLHKMKKLQGEGPLADLILEKNVILTRILEVQVMKM
jgi:hypothetical protein